MHSHKNTVNVEQVLQIGGFTYLTPPPKPLEEHRATQLNKPSSSYALMQQSISTPQGEKPQQDLTPNESVKPTAPENLRITPVEVLLASEPTLKPLLAKKTNFFSRMFSSAKPASGPDTSQAPTTFAYR